MDAVDVVKAHGGLAARRTILEAGVKRHELDHALALGRVLRIRRGLYCLGVDGGVEMTRLALAVTGGVISHDTAASLHGVEMAHQPGRHLTVPRDRRRTTYPGARIHRRDLRPDEIVQIDGMAVTAALRTVLDCARTLDVRDAVVVADSAMRQFKVQPADLDEAAAAARGPGSGRIREVVDLCDPFTDSVLESVLRMLLSEHGMRPQVTQFEFRARGVLMARADFAWPDLRVIVQADGFGYHSDRKTFLKDLRFGNFCTITGWRLLRYGWEHVFHEPSYVLRATRKVLDEAAGRPTRSAVRA
jgi:very-short-patch-repair endonuclease